MKPHKIIAIIVYSGLMLATSLIPMEVDVSDPSFVSGIPSTWQNALHVPMFALFVFLLLDGTKPLSLQRGTRFLLAIALAIVFGIVLEIIQIPIPGRYPSLNDILFNLLGVGIGILTHMGKERLVRAS
jgi:VanZ family protein